MSDTTVSRSPRRQAALENMIDAQIALEDCGAFVPEPTAEVRDIEMHGTRHPVQDGEAVILLIACRRNLLAQQRDEELGGCRWVADDSGIPGSVACTTCGHAEGPGMHRNAVLRSMVDGTYTGPRQGLGVTFTRRLGEPDSTVEITGDPQTLVDLGLAKSVTRNPDGTATVELAGEIRETKVTTPLAPDMLEIDTSRIEIVGGTALGVLGLEESIAQVSVDIRTTVDPGTGDVSLIVVNGVHPDD